MPTADTAANPNGSSPSVKTPPTKDQLVRFEEIVANVLTSRSQLWQKYLDPRRDIDDDCGYPKGWIDGTFYQDLYDRDAIAARVVQVLPRESWQVYPWIYEDENPNKTTVFEKAWDDIGRDLRGGNFFQDHEGSPIWEYLLRADELSGIGRYGILLLGIDDGRKLSEPAVPGDAKKPRKILYLRAFPEAQAQIVRREEDVSNPRFGQPTAYLVTFDDPRQNLAIGTGSLSHEVHWTRVIHLADNMGPSEMLGVPRMQQVLNRVLDLRKLYSGSAEMYWRGAFPGLSIETHPSLGADIVLDTESMRDQIESYMNSLQRYMAMTGVTTKSIAPQVVDPTPQINCQIEAICIKLGVPKRVFLGSERGELASSQDDAAWNDRLRSRQSFYITPRIIVPFVDRLIELAVLPEPKGYSVEWPNLASLSEQEQANVGAVQTNSMSQYVSAGIETLMAPVDFLTYVLRLTPAEAKAIIDNAVELAEERLKEEEKLRKEALADATTEGVTDPETGLPLPDLARPVVDKTQPPAKTAKKAPRPAPRPRGVGGRPKGQ